MTNRLDIAKELAEYYDHGKHLYIRKKKAHDYVLGYTMFAVDEGYMVPVSTGYGFVHCEASEPVEKMEAVTIIVCGEQRNDK